MAEKLFSKREEFLVFGAPLIEEDEIEEVVSCMRSGWLGTGPRVSMFEEEFCSYKGASHAVAINSCTGALHLSLLACNLDPGDEVITTAMTFCATVNAIIHSGAKPVLADVDPETMNIDPASIESAITDRTRAIIPVHFAGRPCDMDAVCEISDKHGLKIIEDCAHAIETEYKGVKAGLFGDFGCFSFYVTKNVVTGEGGMVLTAREKDAERIKMLALHGMTKDAWKRFSDEGYKHYFVAEAGFKYNMMDIQAAIGIHQLRRIDKCWERRKKIWDYYQSEFSALPVVIPSESERETRHGYHLYTLLIDEETAGISRDEFLGEMTKMNIGVGVHYLSIPEHPFYQDKYGWKPEDYPEAMSAGRRTVSLPLSPGLSDKDVEDVVNTVRHIIKCN
ncbi:MAG TPA: DegT/DnrJ/EryC1/StrS family aminotransferase [bacterium]|nr:DegT/DnrJ/EryC1/StrS family aminotransferase [bacterium]